MAAVAGAKVASPFYNEAQLVRVVYDFSVDAGAVGALDLLTVSKASVVRLKHLVVKTACTSGGSATVAVGVTGATTAFVDATEGAVANLTANAVVDGASAPKYCAAGAKCVLTIGTAALTAGKVEAVFEVVAA